MLRGKTEAWPGPGSQEQAVADRQPRLAGRVIASGVSVGLRARVVKWSTSARLDQEQAEVTGLVARQGGVLGCA